MYSAPPPSTSGRPPLPVGTLFSQAFDLFRRHSSLFMGLAAIQVLPALFLVVALQATGVGTRGTDQLTVLLEETQKRLDAGGAGDPAALQGFPWGLPTDDVVRLLVWSLAVFFAQYFIFRTIALAASVTAVGDAFQSQTPSWAKSLGGALRHLPALLGWAILSGIAMIGSIVLLLIPCLGILVWLGLVVFLSVRLMLVPQVIVAEGMGTFQAMGRSWDLTRNSFGRVLGVLVLFVLVVGIAATFVTTLLSAIVIGIAGPDSGLAIAFNQGVSTIVSLITTPLAYIGFTLLYYDQRLRLSTPTPPPPTYPTYPPYQ